MKRTMMISAVVLATTLGASGTAMAGDPVVGAIVGSGLGAVIGHAVGGRNGAVVGGMIGAGTGVAIANDGEEQRTSYYSDDDYRYAPPPPVRVQPQVVYESVPVVVRPVPYYVSYYPVGYYGRHEFREHGGWHRGWDHDDHDGRGRDRGDRGGHGRWHDDR